MGVVGKGEFLVFVEMLLIFFFFGFLKKRLVDWEFGSYFSVFGVIRGEGVGGKGRIIVYFFYFYFGWFYLLG